MWKETPRKQKHYTKLRKNKNKTQQQTKPSSKNKQDTR